MRRPALGLVMLAALLFMPIAAPAQDAPPIVGFCAVCHGETGPSPFPGVPTIHGLPEGVLEHSLHAFQDRERPCRVSECSTLGTCPDVNMCDIVASLGDEDIARLAAWYAGQPFAPHRDPYDPDLAERGRSLHAVYCEVCHTSLGSEPFDDASLLRGQRKAYLRTAMEDFRAGRRSAGLAAMDNRLRALEDEDIAALAEFYSGPATYPLDAR
jgi:cytochrome subunit of sulfide dehydrogenase